MSSVLKKADAEKIVFNVKPKPINLGPSVVAKNFVKMQGENEKDFIISEIVSKQTGISGLRQKNIESQVEELVLEKLKEVQEKAYQQAYDLGFIEGKEKAFQDMKSHFETRLQAFDDFLKNTDSIMVRMSKESEALLIKLVFEIAEKIALKSIAENKDTIVQLLKNLSQEAQGAHQIRVLLSAEDAKFIEDLRAKGVKDAEVLERLKVDFSTDIQSGGCVLHTEYGEIDATIKERVERAWQTISGKVPNLSKAEKS